jgi:uncharacterized membrane protein YkgB
MASPARSLTARALNLLPTVEAIAAILGRYGLVIVIGWIGALKFANFEAHHIQPLIAHSPFMGWLYGFPPAYTFSSVTRCLRSDRCSAAGCQTDHPQALDRWQSDRNRAVHLHRQLSVHHPGSRRARR